MFQNFVKENYGKDIATLTTTELETAIQKYSKKEALSFANWLSYQKLTGKSIESLWGKYQKEIFG